MTAQAAKKGGLSCLKTFGLRYRVLCVKPSRHQHPLEPLYMPQPHANLILICEKHPENGPREPA
jgi:hypothetical protein